jgi:endonuclease/exonuclease/phosphatase family metal-dependent hydrolase
MSLDVIEAGSFAANAIPQPTEMIRVVSWNVARGSRLDEIIEFLRSTNAHLICLQETDCNARRTGCRNVAAAIAGALRMNYVFGIEFEELTQGSTKSPAYHGQATLSVFPLTGSRIVRFREQSRFWHPYWWVPKLARLQRRLGGRMALLSRVRIGERVLIVYNLHLESRSEKVRRAQLSELLEDSRRYSGNIPVLLAGDFNFDVTEHTATDLFANTCFQNPFSPQRVRTTPSNHFGREGAIDWMLIKGALRSDAARVYNCIAASDHYPLSLMLQVP